MAKMQARKLAGLDAEIVDDRGTLFKVRDGEDVTTLTVCTAFYNLCAYGKSESRNIARKRRELAKRFARPHTEVILSKDEFERLEKIVDVNDTNQPVIVIDYLADALESGEWVAVAEDGAKALPAAESDAPGESKPVVSPNPETGTTEAAPRLLPNAPGWDNLAQ